MTSEPGDFDFTSDRDVGLWDEMPLWSSLAGTLLLDHLPLDARRVLDVGCGTGFPALEVADRLGATARVAGIDPWGPAIRRAGAKRRSWSVTNADLVRGDAAAMPFRDGVFDLAISNLGINNFADPTASFAECRRVLVPDGTLALSTNVVGHFAELYEAYEQVLADDHAARERLRAHVAHRGTAETIRQRLESCGFRRFEVFERRVGFRFRDGAAVLRHHFIRLGFLPAWREVAGERAGEHLAMLRKRLDESARAAGELRLTVPLIAILARRA